LTLVFFLPPTSQAFIFSSFSKPPFFNNHSPITGITMASGTGDGDTLPPNEGALLVSNVHLIGADSDLQLVLASQSPRRKEIFDMIGLKDRFTQSPSPLDESELQRRLSSQSITPEVYTQKLAEEKAKALAVTMTKESQKFLIVGSDTIVDLNGKILEKPATTEEAKYMLGQLSDNWHKVHTGVSIYHVGGKANEATQLSSFTDTARVYFAKLSPSDIDAYVSTGEPMDKVSFRT